MSTANATRSFDWCGLSGRRYRYGIHLLDTTFKAVPGNYIFAKETSPGQYLPIYIGQTGDLSERFDGHHKMPCVRRQGATHVHVHRNDGGVAARLSEEADLVDRLNPPCNG